MNQEQYRISYLQLQHDMAKIQKCLCKSGLLIKNFDMYVEVAAIIDPITSDTLERHLYRHVLHPFMPCFANGNAAYSYLMEGSSEGDPFNHSEWPNVKGVTAFMCACSDESYQFMEGWYFTRIPRDNAKKERKDENLRGRCLYLFVDSTLKYDEYTTRNLQDLAQRFQRVDYLVLDVHEHGRKVPWTKGSILMIGNIFKPKKGVILRNELAKLVRYDDLEALELDDVQCADVGMLGEMNTTQHGGEELCTFF